ncbi:MAG: DUF427 domain-containing protein [Thermoleophilaceae bacterium]
MSLTHGSGPFGDRPAGRFNRDIDPEGLFYLEESPKWIRARLDGETVVDSRNPRLLHEHDRLPVFWFPREEVRMDLVGELARTSDEPLLEGLVSFDWGGMDEWLEEDERLVGHARDPYSRIDVRDTSRHVKVSIDGETVAESRRTKVLFEAGLPPRWYFPREDVRMDLLADSDKQTTCAYKGFASYSSVGDHDDVAWTYLDPLHDALPVKGLIAFFNERVDLEVDGEKADRPHTQWSR